MSSSVDTALPVACARRGTGRLGTAGPIAPVAASPRGEAATPRRPATAALGCAPGRSGARPSGDVDATAAADATGRSGKPGGASVTGVSAPDAERGASDPTVTGASGRANPAPAGARPKSRNPTTPAADATAIPTARPFERDRFVRSSAGVATRSVPHGREVPGVEPEPA